MSKLEDLQPGLRLAGVIPGQNVSVIAVQPHGADTIELTYKTAAGELGQRVLGRDAEAKLALANVEARPLDADAAVFKLNVTGPEPALLSAEEARGRQGPSQLRARSAQLSCAPTVLHRIAADVIES